MARGSGPGFRAPAGRAAEALRGGSALPGELPGSPPPPAALRSRRGSWPRVWARRRVRALRGGVAGYVRLVAVRGVGSEVPGLTGTNLKPP